MFADRPPRLIPARPAVVAFAVCVVLGMVADLALAAETFRWVGPAVYLVAGAVVLLADLPPTRRPGWRLIQVATGGGCVASGIWIALGGA
ncbi:hypothetical protein [Patulibacter americanus]|uniref:hypothetical protein n=1 Tax=Patulibacter americanus TaxID=588672 RepID=UPI0003B72854|nr:hypothetical protein [Patulibacter americanus]